MYIYVCEYASSFSDVMCGIFVSPFCFLSVDSIDVEQQDALIEMVGVLLDDKDPLVLGSAIFTFNQVCPDRWALIHQQYRKCTWALTVIFSADRVNASLRSSTSERLSVLY
jgi:hypothetical protein